MPPGTEGIRVRERLRVALIAAGILMSLSGCAALEETRKNGAHFAT